MTSPTNLSVPVILGEVATGEELVCTLGDWSNRPHTFSMQWKANGVNVGTDSTKYIKQAGHSTPITVVVTATNPDGSTSATSANADTSAFTALDAVTDGGCKTLTAVGSINVGVSATTLTLTSNPGFAIGDTIIVEIGGEAGAGVRGTMGVGGAWPIVSYATTALLLAATPAANTYSWAQDTGHVWQYTGGSWVDTTLHTDAYGYYFSMANPLSLRTTLTNVVGNVLTLNTAATVSTTNANVYFDCADVLATAINTTFAGSYKKWTVRADRYAVGNFALWTNDDFILQGVGSSSSIFFAPKGITAYNCGPYQKSKCLIRDLGIEGNLGENGTGFIYPTADQTALPTLTGGLRLDSCTSSINLRCSGLNTPRLTAAISATDCWVYDSSCTLTEPIRSYLQWQYNWANHTGGGFIDCSFISPYLTSAWETFAGARLRMIRCTSQNGTFSVNGSGGWTIHTPNLTITPNSQFSFLSFSELNPLININNIIGNTDPIINAGGALINPSFVQQGYVDAANDALVSIIVSTLPDIQIIGTYPACDSPKGLISSPDWVSGSGIAGASAVGLQNSAPSTSITGIRLTAHPDYSTWGNVHCFGGSAITVTNCVMDHAAMGSGTITEAGTLTNADWASGCANNQQTLLGAACM